MICSCRTSSIAAASASSPSSFSEDFAFLRLPFRLPLAALAALAEGLGLRFGGWLPPRTLRDLGLRIILGCSPPLARAAAKDLASITRGGRAWDWLVRAGGPLGLRGRLEGVADEGRVLGLRLSNGRVLEFKFPNQISRHNCTTVFILLNVLLDVPTGWLGLIFGGHCTSTGELASRCRKTEFCPLTVQRDLPQLWPKHIVF